jgi:hypothetical protein
MSDDPGSRAGERWKKLHEEEALASRRRLVIFGIACAVGWVPYYIGAVGTGVVAALASFLIYVAVWFALHQLLGVKIVWW